MGLGLSLGVLALILICYFSTRRHAYDSRSLPGIAGNSLKAFAVDMKDILRDRLAVAVFAYFGIAQFGMLLVSQIQMFTYRFFMGFPDFLKTIVHGSGMVGLQEMLLAAEPGPNGSIHLFPAWPEAWDVRFKLHAPGPTMIECELRGGKVVKLEVTPAE